MMLFLINSLSICLSGMMETVVDQCRIAFNIDRRHPHGLFQEKS